MVLLHMMLLHTLIPVKIIKKMSFSTFLPVGNSYYVVDSITCSYASILLALVLEMHFSLLRTSAIKCAV